MQLHLSVRSPGIAVDAILAPEALPKLMELIQEHQVSDPSPGLELRGPRRARRRHLSGNSKPIELDEEALSVRDRVKAFPDPKAFFQTAQPKNFPEKFLTLAAWHSATSDEDVFKGRHLIRALVSLGETPPANPPRDVHQAIDQGWIIRRHPESRLLSLTNEGWKRLGAMLDESSS